MLIGELSKRSGVSKDTIRYYEKIELLCADSRDHWNSYKHYGSSALQRLINIKTLQGAGFALVEISELLRRDAKHHPCNALPERIVGKIAQIDHEVSALLRVREQLQFVAKSCDETCTDCGGLPSCIPHQRLISAAG